MSWERPAGPSPLGGTRRDVFALAMRIMGEPAWKDTVAPQHDHTLGSEQGLTFARDNRTVLTRLFNCPRCGDAAADRIWPLALAEAARRLEIEWHDEDARAS